MVAALTAAAFAPNLVFVVADDFDRAVGMTLAKIDELGIRDNTYVIYMLANCGPIRYVRGGNANVTEGGLRLPLLMRGPGIEQGSFGDVPVVGYYLLPTVLDFVSPEASPHPGAEGGDCEPTLLRVCGPGIDRRVDRNVFFSAAARGREPGPQAAILRDNLKLLYRWAERPAALFNMDADPRETRDIAAKHQDLAGRLQRNLMDHPQEGLGEETLARLQSGEYSLGPERRDRPRFREDRRTRSGPRQGRTQTR